MFCKCSDHRRARAGGGHGGRPASVINQGVTLGRRDRPTKRSTIGTAAQFGFRANGAHRRAGRKSSAAVCSSQLRVVRSRELCDGGHRQAGRFTPWLVVVGHSNGRIRAQFRLLGHRRARGAGLLSARPAPKRNYSLRALRTPRPAHAAQNRLRFLCRRARVWRPGLDERIWRQSENAFGPSSSAGTVASVLSLAALSEARR